MVKKSVKQSFVVNMMIMTGTMLLIRIIGMSFNIYFTSVVGASSTGKYHLLFSAYGFMLTFSVAGTGLAATRLVSQVGGCKAAARMAVGKCLRVCFVFSAAATVLVICFRQRLGYVLVGDATSSVALGILASSLIPVAASAVFRGYFLAVRRVGTVTLSQLTEELSQIAITMWLLKFLRHTDYGYISMLGGIGGSALIAGCFDFCAYRIYLAGCKGDGDIMSPGYRGVLAISLPITAGALLRSALVLIENMLIPHTLSLYGMEDAMGEYGIIKGMSIPLILFPTVFSSSFSQLLVTEMSERRAEHKPNGIRYIAGRACSCTMWFSFFIAGAVLLWHREIASAFYSEPRVSVYLGMLSLLVVPMYLDTVVDGMLKGLNQQMSSLRYNIADSVLRVCMILCMVPFVGPVGYIAMLYISELFNLSLSLGRLIKVSGLRFRLRYITIPLTACVAAGVCSCILHMGLIWRMLIYAVVYLTAIVISEHKS